MYVIQPTERQREIELQIIASKARDNDKTVERNKKYRKRKAKK